MKRKGFIKKALVYTVIGATVAGNTMPAFAYTNSVGSVDATQDITESQAAECEVYAELGTNFLVTIPKKLTLSGSTKKGAYTVDVEGDIGGSDIVKVVPDASVALRSANIADVTATISQDKTEWSYSEILSKVTGNGAIDATGITAGAWNGTFNFNVGLESTGAGDSGSETPVALEAGLYDADGVMLCTWEESGIDVATNYSGSSSASNYNKTSTTSGYYVLTNNYPTATKVVIPDSVTSIGNCVFEDCSNLTSITISNSVTSIGTWAFAECTNLTSIEIPDSVTSIGDYAFYGCKSLTSITIPDGITSIGKSAFNSCTSLTNITIPDGITSIGKYAFQNCTNLSSIEIPDSVTSIGEYAFSSCSNLTSVRLPNNLSSIEKDLFWQSGITSIEIPDSVTSIGYAAFCYCSNLTSVTIGSGVKNIGSNAFYDCSNLTSVTFKTTSGWYVGNSAGTKTTALTSSKLANTSTAATYLKSTYLDKYWTR